MEEHRTTVPEDSAEKAAPAPRGKVSPKPAAGRRPKPPSPSSISLRYAQARRLMRDGAFLFKVVAALVTGLIAFFVIMAAGLGAERQSDIVMDRAIAGFCVSATIMFLACFWLDKRGIPLYVSKHEELQSSWVSEPDDEEEEALLAELAERELAAEAGAAGAEEMANEPPAEAAEAGEEPETAEPPEGEEAAPDEGEAADGFAPLADTAERIEAPR